MRRALALIVLAGALAACGADGEPTQPLPDDDSTAPKVTGEARIGMTVSQSGVRPNAQLGLGRGPVWLQIGF